MKGGETWRYRLRFLDLGGQPVEVVDAGATNDPLAIGSRVSVIFPHDQPAKALLFSRERLILPLGLFLFGVGAWFVPA